LPKILIVCAEGSPRLTSNASDIPTITTQLDEASRASPFGSVPLIPATTYPKVNSVEIIFYKTADNLESLHQSPHLEFK
jgi:hypothetical protein